MNGSPAIYGGVVYVGASDGALHAVSLADGHRIVAYALGVPIASSPAIVDNKLYLGGIDGVLYSFAVGE